MKANELRIGNFVYLSDKGKIWEILDGHEIDECDDNAFSQPIPLTEEWLLKFGFERKESSSCIVYHIGMNEVTHDWLFNLTWLKRPELIKAPNVPFYKNGRHYIYYVHQLQNLYFALTGEELTYGDNK